MLNKAILLTKKSSTSFDMEFYVVFEIVGSSPVYAHGAYGESKTIVGDFHLILIMGSLIGFGDSDGNALEIGADVILVKNMTTGFSQYAQKVPSGSGYELLGSEPLLGVVAGEMYHFGVSKVNVQ